MGKLHRRKPQRRQVGRVSIYVDGRCLRPRGGNLPEKLAAYLRHAVAGRQRRSTREAANVGTCAVFVQRFWSARHDGRLYPLPPRNAAPRNRTGAATMTALLIARGHFLQSVMNYFVQAANQRRAECVFRSKPNVDRYSCTHQLPPMQIKSRSRCVRIPC
jgi:hypothetical protein